MKQLPLIGLILFFISCNKQDASEKSILQAPSTYFPNEKIKVLVVGTFHFDYPGLDVQKAKEEDKIDVLIEPKKTEVTEVVEYIKAFKPTKIAIEAFDNWNATDKLRGYKKGEYRDMSD